MTATPTAPVGIPPAVTEETAPFWEAAAAGRLLVERCVRCEAESFPPYGMCRACRGRDVEHVEITGPGHVYSFTVNYQRWMPGLEVPYALVLVEFAGHPGVRVFGRLRGCPPQEARIGMAVEVGFEPGPGGYAVPSFIAVAAESAVPAEGAAGAERAA
ncbi:OB-fold domain-containing protein [Frankia sp. CNm7]|uniref:OB-fold domain-containing protein n=1 Tax=Frankia nepalensis TaxID=1836974 RepID=A0A937RF97_9ACTN|nr:OB-fold domain-containing protein [Frankia nepalensis]MBL7495197.1 OB-fold domain-containing protein [Frankia nepalensis]MBL7515263.1 OB-fold domain-containing protein [Frankia nepalensis]MBL7519179.1 OB-fold domain-containing protein [Frankia nepalensis]MBL7628947.1 OB-fold domain-containing protein [Frankia nepalensis]